MAEYRPIKTDVWRDGWFSTLTPEEKIVWIFLLTNESVHISGIYELPKPLISPFTGVENALEILEKFEQKKKIHIREGWIFITNYLKNQTKQINKKDNIVKSIYAFFTENPQLIDLFNLNEQAPYKDLLRGFQGATKTLSRPLPKGESRKVGKRKEERVVSVDNGLESKKWTDAEIGKMLAQGLKPYLEGDRAFYAGNGNWRVKTHSGEWVDYAGSIIQNLTWK